MAEHTPKFCQIQEISDKLTHFIIWQIDITGKCLCVRNIYLYLYKETYSVTSGKISYYRINFSICLTIRNQITYFIFLIISNDHEISICLLAEMLVPTQNQMRITYFPFSPNAKQYISVESMKKARIKFCSSVKFLYFCSSKSKIARQVWRLSFEDDISVGAMLKSVIWR